MACKVYVVSTGKGGAGKTTVALWLTQYLRAAGHLPLCLDTDPQNPVYSRFDALGVKFIKVATDTKTKSGLVRRQISDSGHDPLMREILAAPPDQDIIIDTGSGNYTQFVSWLVRMQIPELILEATGREFVMNAVLGGGSSFGECLKCLADLLVALPEPTGFVVWLNPYDGKLELDGRSFEDTALYENNRHRIKAIVEMPEYNDPRDKKVLSDVFSTHRCFEEVLADPDKDLMDRRRISIAMKEIYEPIGATGLF